MAPAIWWAAPLRPTPRTTTRTGRNTGAAAWWQAVCATTHQLLADRHRRRRHCRRGVQRHDDGLPLPVAADGTPLRSCIIWADQRTGERLSSPNAVALASLSALRHRTSRPTVRRRSCGCATTSRRSMRTAKFLVPKRFHRSQADRRFATDYSGASGTLLFDLVRAPATVSRTLGLSAEQLPAPPSPPSSVR